MKTLYLAALLALASCQKIPELNLSYEVDDALYRCLHNNGINTTDYVNAAFTEVSEKLKDSVKLNLVGIKVNECLPAKYWLDFRTDYLAVHLLASDSVIVTDHGSKIGLLLYFEADDFSLSAYYDFTLGFYPNANGVYRDTNFVVRNNFMSRGEERLPVKINVTKVN